MRKAITLLFMSSMVVFGAEENALKADEDAIRESIVELRASI